MDLGHVAWGRVRLRFRVRVRIRVIPWSNCMTHTTAEKTLNLESGFGDRVWVRLWECGLGLGMAWG